jgi:hypothetical protein
MQYAEWWLPSCVTPQLITATAPLSDNLSAAGTAAAAAVAEFHAQGDHSRRHHPELPLTAQFNRYRADVPNGQVRSHMLLDSLGVDSERTAFSGCAGIEHCAQSATVYSRCLHNAACTAGSRPRYNVLIAAAACCRHCCAVAVLP